MNHCSRQRKCARGYVVVKTIGFILVSLMFSFMAIDMGLYFSAQNQLQTAADAGALAGAQRLFQGGDPSPAVAQYAAIDDAVEIAQDNVPFTTVLESDVTVGYIDPETGYDPAAFEAGAPSGYEFTGGFNAVRVNVWSDDDHDGSIPTLMARLVGLNQMQSVASGTAYMDDQIGEITGGVRPLYGCLAQFEAAGADGNYSNDTIRFYANNWEMNGDPSTCPILGPGNWGFADLRNCDPDAVGVNTLREWFRNGYSGTVTTAECYSTQPGNPIPAVSSELDTLIANQTVIVIPLIDGFSGSGSNTEVSVAGFSGFVITDYRATGPAFSRYVEGYFTRAACPGVCSRGEGEVAGGGIAKLRLTGTH